MKGRERVMVLICFALVSSTIYYLIFTAHSAVRTITHLIFHLHPSKAIIECLTQNNSPSPPSPQPSTSHQPTSLMAGVVVFCGRWMQAKKFRSRLPEQRACGRANVIVWMGRGSQEIKVHYEGIFCHLRVSFELILPDQLQLWGPTSNWALGAGRPQEIEQDRKDFGGPLSAI